MKTAEQHIHIMRKEPDYYYGTTCSRPRGALHSEVASLAHAYTKYLYDICRVVRRKLFEIDVRVAGARSSELKWIAPAKRTSTASSVEPHACATEATSNVMHRDAACIHCGSSVFRMYSSINSSLVAPCCLCCLVYVVVFTIKAISDPPCGPCLNLLLCAQQQRHLSYLR